MTDKSALMELRERTGAPLIECKKCLNETQGDIEKAVLLLRKRGIDSAVEKADRAAPEGIIGSYVHTNGKLAALVALACETDFVARTDEFKTLARDLAMHIAAMAPEFIKPSDIPPRIIEKEKEIYRAQLKREGKGDNLIEKIIEGKLAKFYSEICLLRQPFVKDDTISVEDVLKQYMAKLGENIDARRMARMTL